MNITAIDKRFRQALILVTVCFGVAKIFVGDENIWLRAAFIICMAGNVGYFTNFLAIKMLFQPKQGKVLGWEGLVPKNQSSIAKSLSESIQTRLLAPEVILDYIGSYNLIESGTQKLVNWVDDMLQDKEIRANVTLKVTSLLKDRGPEILESVFNFSEENLKKLAQDPKEIEKYWAMLRKRIIEHVEAQENRERLASAVQRILRDELPKLATGINLALEKYLERKKAVGALGRGLKKMISFDNEAIENMLQKFIDDPETAEQLMGTMDILVEQFEDKLNADETKAFIVEKVEKWLTQGGDFARQNILPTSIEKLRNFLDDEKNWKQVDEQFFKAMDWIKKNALEFVNSKEGQEYLSTSIQTAVHKINVTQLVEEQVMKLDTDDLEKMILDNTGGNLVVIQTLGGVLGLIAGFIQVHVYFALPVAGLVASAWISHRRNDKRITRMAAEAEVTS